MTAHATFTLERNYPANSERVFAQWENPTNKAKWFATPQATHELDFRVGGREHVQAEVDGKRVVFESWYRDIVDGKRIVFTSTLSANDELSTVSITTVEFTPVDEGTRLTLTEQGTYLDGYEQPEWREKGTLDQLEALAAALA